MWSLASWKKTFVENERTNLSKLCEIDDVVRKRDMVSVGKLDGNFEDSKINNNCNVWSKLIEKRGCQELTIVLGSEETLNRTAKANEVRWYGHVLRRDDNDV